MPPRESSGYSLRDQLRDEAEASRRNAQEQESRAQADRAFSEAHLLPAMRAAAEYYESAIADLNAIDREVTALFPIGPSSARHVPFRQTGYQIFVDHPGRPSSIAVTCACDMKISATRYVASVVEADSFEKYLREMGIEFHRRRQEDLSSGETEKSKFVMEGSVTAGFTLNTLPELRGIEVVTRNLEPEPRRSHRLKLEDLDEAFFETLLRLLLRQTDRLFNHEIDPQTKAWLREQAQRQKQEREQALADAAPRGLLASGQAVTEQISASAVPAIGATVKKTQQLARRLLQRVRTRGETRGD